MAVDDVATALINLHDPEVRARVASVGDREPGAVASTVGVDDLTDEEAQLVLDAALEEPEVEGFNIVASRYYAPLTYVANNRLALTPVVRLNFNKFFQNTYGSAWTIALMG
jgi:hypothetical protein